MRKNQRILRVVRIVPSHVCLTEFALIAGIMPGEKLSKRYNAKAGFKKTPRIGFDLMGNDNNPHDLIDAVQSLEPDEPIHFVLIGDPSFFSGFKKIKPAHIETVIAKETIEMEEAPLPAIRKKKNSSLCIGMDLLKELKIDAFVSAGNTGALMAGAKKYLSMLPNILRPALLALLPTRKKPVAVLDVGANVQYKARHLIQFAEMGISFQKIRGVKKPRVGLLNIGTEALKGTSELRLAYKELVKEKRFIFKGNIEGKEIFEGNVDVLITDGFTGNIMLKTSEGIASFILDRLEENIPAKEFVPLEALLKDLQGHLHYAEYRGALLCGVNGIVIKCHGYSTPHAIMNGIQAAAQMVRQDLLYSFSSVLS